MSITNLSALASSAADIMRALPKMQPLIHCMTNHVTVNDCANILLAAGASPAMIDSADEAFGFAQLAGALYINIGTLYKEQELAMLQAALGARKAGVPIVIDPVACGAIPARAALVEKLSSLSGVSVIKGNMGEILALSGGEGGSKGVDSSGDIAGIEAAAESVARKYNCVVAATGAQDVVTDGSHTIRLHNGNEMLTRITGAGCMVGALCAGTAAAACAMEAGGVQKKSSLEGVIAGDYFAATVAAISMMSIAGERAAQKASAPGSFRTALIDAIYELSPQELAERIRFTIKEES